MQELTTTIICGDQGAGKTKLGLDIYRQHHGPKLKTFCNTECKAVQEWPAEQRARTLLWVDETRSVCHTITEAYKLGYRQILICTQSDAVAVRRVLDRYGMPKGIYKIVPLELVVIGMNIKGEVSKRRIA